MADTLRQPNARQIAYARVEVKAARKLGREPDPEAVRLASYDLDEALAAEARGRH